MKKTIIANWKMNLTFKESVSLASKMIKLNTQYKIIICPDYLSLNTISLKIKNTSILLGSQNCAAFNYGSHTGEISANSLKEIGIKYTIIGHSERRKEQGENNEVIKEKIKLALNAGLKVILCVGENEEERKNKKTKKIIGSQTKIALQDLTSKELKNVSIAYEPIWAIGSGNIPKVEDVREISLYLKDIVYSFSNNKISVYYGGSITSNNCEDFLNVKEIDGLLIGGASLNFKEFSKICN